MLAATGCLNKISYFKIEYDKSDISEEINDFFRLIDIKMYGDGGC